MAFAAIPLIAPIVDKVLGIFDKIIPDTNARDAAKAAFAREVMELDYKTISDQIAVNLQEAKSDRLFVSGWRPFVGWVCGSALAWQFVVQPFMAFFIAWYKWQLPPLPTLDTGSLMALLMGMLGLGGMRTYEKLNGAQNNKTGS